MRNAAVLCLALLFFRSLPLTAAIDPIFRAIDLNVGERETIRLHNGATATVELLGRDEVRDSLRNAVRRASVRVQVNGREATLGCGNYNLPLTVAGVQIDCTVTKGYLDNARSNIWGLDKDARLRLWPAGSSWIAAGTYVYPVKQRWFASNTQMANEPSFVDGSEEPFTKTVYYHYGLDIGGAEAITQVVSATDGMVVTRGFDALPEYKNSPYTELNYDGVIVLDDRGWFHWYFHLSSIDPGIKLGQRVKMGQNVGLIGKEGHAGCWSHLHYEIRSLQPSRKAGIQEGYAFLWEAYRKQYSPEVIANARPHLFAWVDEPVTLDAGLSWSRNGKIARYEWLFSDGSRREGRTVQRTYARPGTYSEILKVTDAKGNTAYDFAVVQIVRKSQRRQREEDLPPTIHASFAPTLDIRPGQPVSFLVRTCRTTDGQETWDFGDGSERVRVKSDGCAVPASKEGYAKTQHAYKQPGDYIVHVERANQRGEKAVANLHVRVRK